MQMGRGNVQEMKLEFMLSYQNYNTKKKIHT